MSRTGATAVNGHFVFDEARPESGASDAEIKRFVATIGQPLSAEEIEAVNLSQRNPFPKGDPLYLAFLRWSNGGWFRSGEREFGFFPTQGPSGVREMMLAYHLPQYMPGALPFAFNGAGTFYLFDMRKKAVSGEYPVVCSHAGNLGWEQDKCCLVADSLEAACRGKVNVDELRLE
jgi:hypothetical protein